MKWNENKEKTNEEIIKEWNDEQGFFGKKYRIKRVRYRNNSEYFIVQYKFMFIWFSYQSTHEYGCSTHYFSKKDDAFNHIVHEINTVRGYVKEEKEVINF
jgi:hypothetical protein